MPLWAYGLCIWLIYSPLMWIQRLENFSSGFIVAVFLILLGVATTSYFAVEVAQEQDGPGPGYVALNRDAYWSMVGFAFYMFEGIGCLLPIMRECEKPERMPAITLGAIWSLAIIQVAFSSVCYYAWGDTLDKPVVTEMLPADNTFVQIMKLLYCINLVYSYRINIVPTFTTLEAYVLGVKETNKDEDMGSDADAVRQHVVEVAPMPQS